MTHIMDEKGKRVPLAKYLAPPKDESEIVWTDDDGEVQRALVSEYLKGDH